MAKNTTPKIHADVEEIFVVHSSKNRPYIEQFHHTPVNFTQKHLGTFLGFFVIHDPTEDSANIVNFLTAEAKKAYFARTDRSAVEAFEAALYRVNRALAEIVGIGNTSWLGVLDGCLCAIDGDTIHCSVTGTAHVLLMRGGELIDISEGLASPEAATQPLKTFADISTGTLFPGDRLILTTPDLLHHVTAQELLRKASAFDRDRFNQFVQTVLVNESEMAHTFIIDVRETSVLETYEHNIMVDDAPQTTAHDTPNVFDANAFADTPQRQSDPLQDIDASAQQVSSAEPQPEYVDARTGHIYLQEQEGDHANASTLAPIFDTTRDFLDDKTHTLASRTKRRWRKLLLGTRAFWQRSRTVADGILHTNNDALTESLDPERPMADIAPRRKKDATAFDDALDTPPHKKPAPQKVAAPSKKASAPKPAASVPEEVQTTDADAAPSLGAHLQSLTASCRSHLQSFGATCARWCKNSWQKIAALCTRAFVWTAGRFGRRSDAPAAHSRVAQNVAPSAALTPQPRSKRERSTMTSPGLLSRCTALLGRLWYRFMGLGMFDRVLVLGACVAVLYAFTTMGGDTPEEPAPVAEETPVVEEEPAAPEIIATIADPETLTEATSHAVALVSGYTVVAEDNRLTALPPEGDTLTKNLPITFGKVTRLLPLGGIGTVLVYSESGNLAIYDPTNNTLREQSSTLDNATAARIALYTTVYVYHVSDTNVLRYDRTDVGLGAPQNWFSANDVVSNLDGDVRALAVDGSVYIAHGNTISKFTDRKKDEDFGTPEVMADLLFAADNTESLWALDTSSSTLVSYSKSGAEQERFTHEVFGAATGIFIDEQLDRAYVTTATGAREFVLEKK